MTRVRQTSMSSFRSMQRGGFKTLEAQIYARFRKGTRVTRQDIAAQTGIAVSSVCARVDSLLKKQLLVEDGKKLSTETNKHRNVLRLFDPAVDSHSRKIHDLILVLLARLNDVGKGREQIKFAGMLPLTPSDGECYRLAKRALCEQLNRQINWLRTQVEAPEAH